jgi:hypothetical protein
LRSESRGVLWLVKGLLVEMNRVSEECGVARYPCCTHQGQQHIERQKGGIRKYSASIVSSVFPRHSFNRFHLLRFKHAFQERAVGCGHTLFLYSGG